MKRKHFGRKCPFPLPRLDGNPLLTVNTKIDPLAEQLIGRVIRPTEGLHWLL